MEDVDSILGDPDAVLVDVVVAVPPNVVPLLDHQGGETQARTGLQSLSLLNWWKLFHLLSNDSTRETGSNNDQVILFLQPVQTPGI